METEFEPGLKNRINWRIILWTAAASLLLVPLVAMQFTPEVVWTGGDFVFAAGMIAIAGTLFELGLRASGSLAYRAGVGVAIAAGFLTIWINGAVGVFADEDNPANLLFLGVILVALVGAVLASFRAGGMARAMLAALAAQVAVAIAVPLAGYASPGVEGVYEAMLAVGLFGGLWLVAALLFFRARGLGA